MGGARALIQFLSYEISASFAWFLMFSFFASFSVFALLHSSFVLFLFFFFVLFVFTVSIVAETQRAPFDFAEGERELVRGFNVEYSSFLFAIIFLTEYGILLFFSWVAAMVFVGVNILTSVFFAMLWGSAVVAIRGSFPRFRFDFLQLFIWKVLLPVSIVFFSVCFLFWFFGV